MPHIQFGLSLTMPTNSHGEANRQAYLTDIQRSLELASGHFDSVWFVDHLQYSDAPILEGWTVLTYLAAQHSQFMFGNAVICQSFRNPALLAKMAATFQYVSGGRFILGIGAGWKEDEYTSYGYQFPPASTRVEELEETLQIIKALWHDECATVHGKHYQVANAYCEPKPDPIPTIMVGAAKPRMLRVVARHADWWNVSWTRIDDYRKQVVECERACTEVGRDPATLRRTWFGGCVCAPSEAALAAVNRKHLTPGNAFVGTPAQLTEQMQPFIDLGVDYFMLSNQGFPDMTTIELLVSEVMPALNR